MESDATYALLENIKMINTVSVMFFTLILVNLFNKLGSDFPHRNIDKQKINIHSGVK